MNAGAPVPAKRRSRGDAVHGQPSRVHRPRHAGGEHVPRRWASAPSDVVSLLLPLVPQSFCRPVRRRGGGHREPGQSAARGRARSPRSCAPRRPRCWWRSARCRAPTSGTRCERIRGELPELKAIVRRRAAQADAAPARPSFDATRSSASRPIACVSGRTIAADDTAAYFHTGGTTGMPKLVRHTPREPGLPGLGHEPDAAHAARARPCCSACRCSTSAAR